MLGGEEQENSPLGKQDKRQVGRVSFSTCRHFLPGDNGLSHRWGVPWGNAASSHKPTQLQGLAEHLAEETRPSACAEVATVAVGEHALSEGDSHSPLHLEITMGPE